MVTPGIGIGNPRASFTSQHLNPEEGNGYGAEIGEAAPVGNGQMSGQSDNQRSSTAKISIPKELPQRYVLVFMGFLAFVNIYMMYLNLSVALPAMVDRNVTTLRELDNEKGPFVENSGALLEAKREKRHKLHKHKAKSKAKLKNITSSSSEDIPITLPPQEIQITSSNTVLIHPPDDFLKAPKLRELSITLENETNSRSGHASSFPRQKPASEPLTSTVDLVPTTQMVTSTSRGEEDISIISSSAISNTTADDKKERLEQVKTDNLISLKSSPGISKEEIFANRNDNSSEGSTLLPSKPSALTTSIPVLEDETSTRNKITSTNSTTEKNEMHLLSESSSKRKEKDSEKLRTKRNVNQEVATDSKPTILIETSPSLAVSNLDTSSFSMSKDSGITNTAVSTDTTEATTKSSVIFPAEQNNPKTVSAEKLRVVNFTLEITSPVSYTTTIPSSTVSGETLMSHQPKNTTSKSLTGSKTFLSDVSLSALKFEPTLKYTPSDSYTTKSSESTKETFESFTTTPRDINLAETADAALQEEVLVITVSSKSTTLPNSHDFYATLSKPTLPHELVSTTADDVQTSPSFTAEPETTISNHPYTSSLNPTSDSEVVLLNYDLYTTSESPGQTETTVFGLEITNSATESEIDLITTTSMPSMAVSFSEEISLNNTTSSRVPNEERIAFTTILPLSAESDKNLTVTATGRDESTTDNSLINPENFMVETPILTGTEATLPSSSVSETLPDLGTTPSSDENELIDENVRTPLYTISTDDIISTYSSSVHLDDADASKNYPSSASQPIEKNASFVLIDSTPFTSLDDRLSNVSENKTGIPLPIFQVNKTSSVNEPSRNPAPLLIPCKTFMYFNCSFFGTYDIIDKRGLKGMAQNDTEWVTLRPRPKNFSYDGLFNVIHNEEEEGEEEMSDEDDRDESKSTLRMAQKYNFTDHFKLVNCSRINATNRDEASGDIQCLSRFGIIRLNIVDESDGLSSSSSSSSSSEEGSDEEESKEEDDDEEDGKDEYEEEEADEKDAEGEKEENEKNRELHPRRNYNRFNLRKRKPEKNEENEEEEEGGKEEEEEKTKKGNEKNEKEEEEKEKKGKEETEKEEEEEEEERNRSFSPRSRNVNVHKNEGDNADCGDSSEECEEEEAEEEEEEEEDEGEEEGEEEEYDEKELSGKYGSSPIKLEGKIPSTVCFVRTIVGEVKYENYENGEFEWNQNIQERILGSYYWGFLVTQIPAGCLSRTIGGKLLLLSGVFFAGLITLLTPVLASQGPYWLLAGRVMLGMAQGVCIPAAYSLLAQWAPPLERTRMVAYTYSGIAVGAALGGPLSEYLMPTIGWRTLFYGQGFLALIWALLWFFLISDSPSQHPKISSKEKQLVLTAIGQQHAGKGLPVPWRGIFRSRHVLGLMLAHGSFMWAWHTLLHYAPRYVSTVLHRSREEVQGVWGAALGCMFVTSCVYGTIADWLRKSRKTSTESVRRAANSICSLLSAGFLVGVAQSYCSIEAVKVCFALAIAMGFPGAFSGIYANILDLAPNHAATIGGICGTFATTANIISPLYWNLIVFERPTLERWRTIWYTSAIFLLLANCLYFLLIGTKEQRWNRPVTLNKTPKRREEEQQGAVSRRRINYGLGIKNQAYASTEHL